MVYYLQRIDERSCLMVQENQQQARLQEPVLVILQRLCMRHGSTFEGRRAAAARNLDIHQKVPILLSEIYRDISDKSNAQSRLYLDQLPCSR